MAASSPARGKPAAYGQEITLRRSRLTLASTSLAGKVVLDFGCGNGAQTLCFRTTGARILGVDLHQADLAVFRRHLNPGDHMLPVQGEGTHLPVVSAGVDLVLSYEVLEHVADESQTLQEIWRVLKPGGELILTVPNKAWIFETHGAHLPWLPWHRVPFFSWLPRGLHRRFAKARIYRKRDILPLLERHGFRVLRALYITAPLDMLPWLRLKRWARALAFRGDTTACPFLATAIFVHARKTGTAVAAGGGQPLAGAGDTPAPLC